MEITLDNKFKVYIEKYDDKEIEFSMFDTRTPEIAKGFQTMLTKEDAKQISKVLDRWVSNLSIE